MARSPASESMRIERLAFHDINPQAPIHILVIPKKEISMVEKLQPEDQALMGHLMVKAAEIARELGLEEGGDRLVLNNGKAAGQEVFHLHLHLLGGRAFAWPPG